MPQWIPDATIVALLERWSQGGSAAHACSHPKLRCMRLSSVLRF